MLVRKVLQITLLFLPWKIRRYLLNRFWRFDIHSTAYIGFSYVYPKSLVMEAGARIGHLNVAIHLDKILLKEKAIINRGNWITGFPTGESSKHFFHQKDRQAELVIGKESSITKNHHIDCTDSIHIGDFVTIAGYRSQFLTHSTDYCVLAAGAVLNKAYDEKWTLYVGVPARPKQSIPRDAKYFSRVKGFVY